MEKSATLAPGVGRRGAAELEVAAPLFCDPLEEVVILISLKLIFYTKKPGDMVFL